jgi:hypothetical protein
MVNIRRTRDPSPMFLSIHPRVHTQQVQVKIKNWNTETIDFNDTLTLDPTSNSFREISNKISLNVFVNSLLYIYFTKLTEDFVEPSVSLFNSF